MTSKDIYSILSSKPHNQHYLNRYWKFVQSFQHQIEIKGVTEEHHICPKSDDLFPEYKSLKRNPWNGIHLTKRQHFIAHWILANAYKGKQIYAFWAMCNQQSPTDSRSRNYKVSSILYEKTKLEISKLISPNKNIGVYKNKNNDIFRVSVNDPRVLSGELVGHSKGKAAYKNKEGVVISMSNIDPRVLSGEFIAESKGRIPHNKLNYTRINPCIICCKYHTKQGKTCSKICAKQYMTNLSAIRRKK